MTRIKFIESQSSIEYGSRKNMQFTIMYRTLESTEYEKLELADASKRTLDNGIIDVEARTNPVNKQIFIKTLKPRPSN